MKKQARVLYVGRVQGVGFRLTVEETAQELGVRGWVRNLRDGRVELVAEAEEAKLQRFLDKLRNGPMRNFIKDVNVSWNPATETFDEFEIRYY